MILMKYHSLFFLKIKKDVAEIALCCSCDWRLKGYITEFSNSFLNHENPETSLFFKAKSVASWSKKW